jgi:general secretion pathway protein C
MIAAITLCVALSGGLYLQLAPFLLDKQTTFKSESLKPTKSALPITKPIKQHNIANFQLFGDTKAIASKPEPILKDLPKTNLRLTLTGVMTSDSTENASALIQGPDKDTISYKIDDKLPGGAILKQVLTDRVVIDRSGRLENLAFDEKRAIGIESYSHPDDDIEENQSSTKPITSARETSNSGKTQGIKDRLSKLRKRMLKNRAAQ